MAWDGKERRDKKRYGIKNSTLRYKRGGMMSVLRSSSPRYLLLNISESGCHFITKRELTLHETLTLSIEAPKITGVIRARGEVVWCRQSEDINAFRVGIRFRSVNGQSRNVLKRLLDSAILENVEISTKVYLKEIERL